MIWLENFPWKDCIRIDQIMDVIRGGVGIIRFEKYEFLGLVGAGGSLLEELKIGFAYCMNAFHTALQGVAMIGQNYNFISSIFCW